MQHLAQHRARNNNAIKTWVHKWTDERMLHWSLLNPQWPGYKCPGCRHDFFSTLFLFSWAVLLSCTFFSGCLSYLHSPGLRACFLGGCFVHCHWLVGFFLSLRLSPTPCCISSPCIDRGSLYAVCLQCQGYTISRGLKKALTTKPTSCLITL